ncbi:MAG: FAD-binding protein [Patescibacteria group bacterium]
MSDWKTSLATKLPQLELRSNEPLAAHTTVKLGGPAEVLALPKSTEELLDTIAVATKAGAPITMLGWGANTLIADRGVCGLVIKPSSTEIIISDDRAALESELQLLPKAPTQPRWIKASDDVQHADFTAVEFSEEGERVLVTMAAGVSLPSAINQLLNQEVTGLQWFARIPASIGGALYNNIHGGTKFIGDYVSSVRAVSTTGHLTTIPNSQLELGYDHSRFHHSNEIIIDANFILYRGDVAQARESMVKWAQQKSIQPQNSLGCIFQNVSEADQRRLELPTPSIGYIIEHVLQLKGYQIGGAKVSEKHAAFIENTGTATAADYLAVIKHIAQEADTRCQLQLRPEIFFYGFTATELAGLTA